VFRNAGRHTVALVDLIWQQTNLWYRVGLIVGSQLRGEWAYGGMGQVVTVHNHCNKILFLLNTTRAMYDLEKSFSILIFMSRDVLEVMALPSVSPPPPDALLSSNPLSAFTLSPAATIRPTTATPLATTAPSLRRQFRPSLCLLSLADSSLVASQRRSDGKTSHIHPSPMLIPC
jgi:hypothetical protein